MFTLKRRGSHCTGGSPHSKAVPGAKQYVASALSVKKKKKKKRIYR
jgi:hypothetical protein